MKFSIGDVVQLKSGGPLLTVTEVEDDTVHCIFFSEEIGEFRMHSFAPVLLAGVDIDDEDEVSDADGDEEEDEDDDEAPKRKRA
jgi:uncharacterized protein YodC (DUF2158 family)